MFLVINLLFMFVEAIYGFWNNSLGLISDAAHMCFDCTALFIGLYASYMAKFTSDKVYTYGYGRYEVLSGFVNGIFLIFVAFSVLAESIERILEPPEITTDNLLLVSVLGLLVNLVGLYWFHGDMGGENM
jgi:zinc transporter 5/7